MRAACPVLHRCPDDAQAAKQRPAAVAALSERSLIAVTVLLELEWVMRGFYGLPVRDILRVLRSLAGIEHVTLEDRDTVLMVWMALDDFNKGLDFADFLHLALRDGLKNAVANARLRH